MLAVSATLHIVVTFAGADPFKMVDLEVYVEGGRHLTDGTLYDFLTSPLNLPFTYPPFSALLFSPLAGIPWWLTRAAWQLASLAALALLVRLSFQLLGTPRPRTPRPPAPGTGVVLVGTAVALWVEPVRTTFNYGQINLFLACLVLGGAVVTSDWLAGLGVGLAAGIKLVPAIAGAYYVLVGRSRAAGWSALFFGGTVALMLAIIPTQTWRYFTRLILDPGRTGPVWSAINQSERGALARLAGHDVSTSWLIAAGLTVLLGGWAAWASAKAGDRMATLLAVQLTGLLISPISWSHHWVWVVPLLIWCFFSIRPPTRAVRATGVAWLIATGSYLVSILTAVQIKELGANRPAWQSWLGVCYPALALLTLGVLLMVARSSSTVRSPA